MPIDKLYRLRGATGPPVKVYRVQRIDRAEGFTITHYNSYRSGGADKEWYT